MKEYIKVKSHLIQNWSTYTPNDFRNIARVMDESGLISLSFECDYDFHPLEERLETDKEYNRRIRQEEKQAAKNKKFEAYNKIKELRELERLKKKYGQLD
jgi:hypothetical protein